jgi:ATP synthase protein I
VYKSFYNLRGKIGEFVKNIHGIKAAKRLLSTQVSVTFLIAICAKIILGNKSAWSAIAGGIVCVLPNAYFAFQLFRHNGAHAAKQIVHGFYKSEAMKLMIAVALFAVVFKFMAVDSLVFFVTYIAVQIVFFLVYVN